MVLLHKLTRPPWRTVVPALLFLLVLAAGYLLWSPGKDITDGRHDLGRNGIWLQHGWLGDDKWFQENGKTNLIPQFRDAEKIRALAAKLRQNHITDVYPHLCPAEMGSGHIPAVNDARTEVFLKEFNGFRVMPWIGGVLDSNVKPSSPAWRKRFIASVMDLLAAHPRFAGVHLNVEPMPSGNVDFLRLLDELRAALPKEKILSVAAYPPPTRWHAFPDVHWDEVYFRQVAAHADQMVVMMYDTSIKVPRLYQSVMASWTRDELSWSGNKPVLLGLPAYEDANVGYHHSDVENLENSLLGIHRGLTKFDGLPPNYQGISIYCEWQMRDSDWEHLQKHFLKH